MWKFCRVVAGVVVLALLGFGGLYLFFPERIADFALGLERQRAGLSPHEVDLHLADGGTLHMAWLEGGSGPPLVLLHGIGADKDNWTRSAHFLTPHYRVIAPDLPGFGDSSRPEDGSYHVADQVRNLEAFTAALKLTRFDLGGNSMGGWIAGAYASAYREQVASLWLLAPAGVGVALPSEMQKRVRAGERVPLFAANPEQFRELLRWVFVHPPYVPGAILKVIAERQARGYALNLRIYEELRADSASMPMERLMQGLDIPTLIAWGTRDRVLDVSGAELLRAVMPRAQTALLPDVGHLPMIEAPQAASEAYLRFRGQIGR